VIRFLQAELVVVAGLIAIAMVWRVMIRQDLSWRDMANLLAAMLIFPVYMTRLAISLLLRRRP
jgi:hypothetical protein